MANFLLTPYDDGPGLNRQTARSHTFPMYGFSTDAEKEENDLYNSMEDEFDEDVSLGIAAKLAVPAAGNNSRVDRAYYGVGNQNTNIFEFSGDHRNTARQGISPFKQPKHSGPPLGTGGSSQAFRTTGPYKRTGTQYGTSRAHKLLTDVEDDSIFSLSDMIDQMERSYMRRNRVKKTLARLKEYLEI